MTRLDEAFATIAVELDLPRDYTEGVVRSLALANMIARAQQDLTGCVAVQFRHSRPGRTVLSDKTPGGLTLYPESQRAIARQDR